MENLNLYKHAKDKLKEEIDPTKRILEIGPLYKPLFLKEEADIYYADIKNTEEIKNRYEYLGEEIVNQIVPIDYVIEGSYENTFKNKNIKFDYVILSHVLEHIPNPIDVLLDISTILSKNGKLCILLPDKNYTFDYYRENSTFADLFDMYKRGESNNTPRILLDNNLGAITENNPSVFWNQKITEYPNPNIEKCMERYNNFITDFDNQNFDGHYWVFTAKSFLKIIENLTKVNIIPYELIAFYPTAYNTNTFGLILELNTNFQKNYTLRKQQIDKIHDLITHMDTELLELKYKKVIEENKSLKNKINKMKEIINE